MSEEGPKLYSSKPKKSQLKPKVKSMSSTPTPNPMNPPSAPSPPPPPSSSSSSSSGLPANKESFARRYKFVWPALLAVNFAIGAYLFVRTKNKTPVVEDGEVAPDAPSTPVASTTTAPTPAASTTAPIGEQSIAEPLKVPKPVVKPQKSIPMDQQRELYKWMLEEKRKIKPKSPEEKKKVDEEKEILKQFIRAKSIPSI